MLYVVYQDGRAEVHTLGSYVKLTAADLANTFVTFDHARALAAARRLRGLS